MKRIWIPLLAVVCLLLGVLAATILRRADNADAALRETAVTLEASVSALSAENEGLRTENAGLETALAEAQAETAALAEETAARKAEAQARADEAAALSAALEETKKPARILENRRVTDNTIAAPHAAELRYLLYEPGIETDEPLPLVLFLHGSGGSFDIYDGDTLPTMLTRGWLAPEALVLMPQCPGPAWDTYCEDLMLLLETVAEQYGADRKRISVTGFSLGGVGCFSMLVNYPDYFSAALPLAAKCFPDKCGVITTTPVRILHGEKDKVMDPTSVRQAVEVINAAGGHATLTMLPGEDHLIQQHYLDDGGEPLEWLIAQRRPD